MPAAPERPTFRDGTGDRHLATIPACAALGIVLVPGADDGVACRIGHQPGARLGDRIAHGAALTLADQATAQGIFATLPAPVPMVTLALRVDWTAAMPTGAITCAIEEVVREGALALVRGVLAGEDGERLAAVSARYLLGAMPGGATTMGPEPDAPQPAWAGDFASYLAFDGGATHRPDWRHVGGRTLPAYHGGIIAALLDAAATAAVPDDLARADVEIRYLAPGRADRPLAILVRTLRGGRRAFTVEAEARQDDDATLVAVARMMFVSTALRA